MINVFEPIVYPRTMELLEKVHTSKWLGRGELSNDFDEKLKDYLQLERFGTASCASHLIEAVIRVSEFKKGSNIVIPTNSFPIIASVILSEGLGCRVADISPETGNICFESVKNVIDENTVAVFITHYGGVPVDVDLLRSIIGTKVRIFEDSATALGTVVDGSSVGSKADFSLWSFDAMKLLVAGEGGGYTSNCEELFNKVRSHLYLGLRPSEKSGLDKVVNSQKSMWWEYQPENFGTRSVFTNIQAAYGLGSFEYLEKRLKRLREIRAMYEVGLHDCVSFISQPESLFEKSITYSNYFCTIQIEQGKRNALASYLRENGVYTTLRYFPISEIPFYAQKCKLPTVLNGTNSFFAKSLNIPCHSNLADSDVEEIIRLIRKFHVG